MSYIEEIARGALQAAHADLARARRTPAAGRGRAGADPPFDRLPLSRGVARDRRHRGVDGGQCRPAGRARARDRGAAGGQCQRRRPAGPAARRRHHRDGRELCRPAQPGGARHGGRDARCATDAAGRLRLTPADATDADADAGSARADADADAAGQSAARSPGVPAARERGADRRVARAARDPGRARRRRAGLGGPDRLCPARHRRGGVRARRAGVGPAHPPGLSARARGEHGRRADGSPGRRRHRRRRPLPPCKPPPTR